MRRPPGRYSAAGPDCRWRFIDGQDQVVLIFTNGKGGPALRFLACL